MNLLAAVLTGFVAVEHVGFLVLEMFLWDTPTGHRIFQRSAADMKASADLAKNQGLYNGFLAAGLAWSLYLGDAGFQNRLFFLGCVVVAAIYGGMTAKKSIIVVQGLPAVLALAFTLAAR